MAAGHQQHVPPYGPLVLRLGPGQPGGSQLDGEVVHCGFFPTPPPPLPYCSSSSSSASLLLVAAPLPSQPISSRLVRGAACSAYITRVLLQPSFLFSFLRFSSFLFYGKSDQKPSQRAVLKPLYADATKSASLYECCSYISYKVWKIWLFLFADSSKCCIHFVKLQSCSTCYVLINKSRCSATLLRSNLGGAEYFLHSFRFVFLFLW